MRRTAGMLLLALIVWLPCPLAWSSGGSLVSSGAFESAGGKATGYREWVDLEGANGLLRGATKASLLKSITVYAPEVQESHLIVRQLKLSDVHESILVSVPDEFRGQIKRATLFLEALPENLSLYEYLDGKWYLREPVNLIGRTHEALGEPSRVHLQAFPVKQLGFYCIGESPPVGNEAPPGPAGHMAPGVLPGGSLWRGVVPLLFATFLTITCGAVAYLLHRIEKSRGC